MRQITLGRKRLVLEQCVLSLIVVILISAETTFLGYYARKTKQKIFRLCKLITKPSHSTYLLETIWFGNFVQT